MPYAAVGVYVCSGPFGLTFHVAGKGENKLKETACFFVEEEKYSTANLGLLCKHGWFHH